MYALDYAIPIVAKRAMTMEGLQNDPIVYLCVIPGRARSARGREPRGLGTI